MEEAETLGADPPPQPLPLLLAHPANTLCHKRNTSPDGFKEKTTILVAKGWQQLLAVKKNKQTKPLCFITNTERRLHGGETRARQTPHPSGDLTPRSTSSPMLGSPDDPQLHLPPSEYGEQQAPVFGAAMSQVRHLSTGSTGASCYTRCARGQNTLLPLQTPSKWPRA